MMRCAGRVAGAGADEARFGGEEAWLGRREARLLWERKRCCNSRYAKDGTGADTAEPA